MLFLLVLSLRLGRFSLHVLLNPSRGNDFVSLADGAIVDLTESNVTPPKITIACLLEDLKRY